jgi:CHASE2 domain-containing sensor protein
MSVAPHRNGHDEYYKVGGSLGLDYPYVERDADKELYENLKKCHFCYVLNSRQMGKSSLRVRTMKKLREDENKSFACCSIDLTIIGSQVTAEQWYGGIVSELIRGFNLLGKINFKDYWENEERKTLSPVQRLERFIEEFLLKEIPFEKKIVIFLDEIDSLLRIKDFPIADFFALIKSCYNKRADNPEYNRLTFAFFGVATPSDLVKNDTRIFFNIGKAIELKGFQPHEALKLATGLEDNAKRPQVVIQEIIKWTGGQPFLTQKVCKLIRSLNVHIFSGKEAKHIKKLVESEVIKDWESKDEPEHLRTIRDRLLRSEEPIPLLQTYYKILQSKTINANDDDNVHLKLRLSGLVTKEKGRLKVSNPIYERVFDDRWVQEQLERLGVTLPPIIPEWITPLFTSAAMTAIVVGVRFTGFLQPFELSALDKLMQLRPPEPIDPRILIVGITEEDLARDGGISISDKTVGEVIEKLQKYQPKVIGLDIFRDIPIREGAAGKLEHEKLLEILKKNNILAACNISKINISESPNFPAPPGILPKNLGFANFTFDRDQILRRQILQQNKSKDCPTELSLSWQLIRKYLDAKRIATPENLEKSPLKIDNLIINPLQAHTGGYQVFDLGDYRGYQILLNYRSSKQPDTPFAQVTAIDLLEEPIKSKLPQLIKDRIVLIGYTAQSKTGDWHLTPYSSAEPYRKMPGVIVHAHMVSQVTSGIEDGRPMLVAWSGWGDAVYILVYPLVGAMLFVYFKHPLVRFVTIASIPLVIFGVSFLVVLYCGIWLPLVPSWIAFSLAILSLGSVKQVLAKTFSLVKGKVRFFSPATNE